MGRILPEDSGRIVLAIFRANDIGANQAMRFASICNAFLAQGRSVCDLSEGICFLIQHGCLRRGLSDEDAFYLTELGAALIVRNRQSVSERSLAEWDEDENGRKPLRARC